jgi:hypothetical protein
MKKAIAQISVSLDTYCPHCEGWNDLLDEHNDSDGEVTNACFQDWNSFDKDFECVHCNKEFNVNEIEH